jgi:hypothetical protein
MDFEFLSPVDESLIEEFSSANSQNLGGQVKFHSSTGGIPDSGRYKNGSCWGAGEPACRRRGG